MGILCGFYFEQAAGMQRFMHNNTSGILKLAIISYYIEIENATEKCVKLMQFSLHKTLNLQEKNIYKGSLLCYNVIWWRIGFFT